MSISLHEQALRCVSNCRKSDSELIEVLAQIDSTRCYLEMGETSLFSYCLKKLSLSESETSRFIQVMRH